MMQKKVLVSLTTTVVKREGNSEFLVKEINELRRLAIKELAFFPTCLVKEERQQAYRWLEEVPDLRIPFVHARSDMRPEEYYYLQKRFGTKCFNLHSARYFPLAHELGELKNSIAVENIGPELYHEDLHGYAGLCLDLAHLEAHRRSGRDNYQRVLEIAKTSGVRANHISASGELFPSRHYPGVMECDKHRLDDLTEIDYLTRYSAEYFGEHVAIELENPLVEQLEIKAYIQQLRPFLS